MNARLKQAVACGCLLMGFVVWTGCGKSGEKTAGGDAGKTSSGSDTVRRVIILTNGDDPFWDAMRAGMQDAEKDLNLAGGGLKAELDKNDGTDKGQADKLQQYANQTDIAAVAISVIDAKNVAVAEGMRKLQKQGIKVLTVDSDVDRERSGDARFAYLGTDNIEGGRELGKAAKGLRPDGGNYVCFVGHKSAANAVERISGFAEGAGESFKAAEDTLADEMDLSTADKNVRDALARHPDLNVLVGIWAYNANAIASTVKDQGVRDKTTVVTFDAPPKALVHFENGLIDAMVVQNPYQMGYDATKLMKALVEDDQETVKTMVPEDKIIVTGLKVVVPDEGSPLKKEMFSESTEFLSFSEFKKWLESKNLKGS
jgi:ribose transport system substrate-binding protein